MPGDGDAVSYADDNTHAYAVDYADRPYDGEVAWSDELVGRLLAVLADTGIAESTLIVVTSDHGEGLGDHGEAVHGYFIYETTLHVPLVVRGPGVKPGYSSPVSLTHRSLLRTVEEMLNLPILPTVQDANDFGDLFVSGSVR